jgi:hypothetical protein
MTETIDTVKARLAPKRVELDGEPYWIAEGDQLLDEDQLGIYAEELNRRAKRRADQGGDAVPDGAVSDVGGPSELIGIKGPDGRLVRWRDGKILTYCVLKNTFASDEEYLVARQSVEKATRAWMDTCGVEFRHDVAKDRSPTTTVKDVVFTVRKIDAGGRFIAAAFFPTDAPSRRRVFIDPSFFAQGLPFDRVGVLRHELGHVLGFRHEHIRVEAPAACPDEDIADTSILTGYDPKSVMHYFCGQVGNPKLLITDLDIVGSQRLYGPPLSAFQLVD